MCAFGVVGMVKGPLESGVAQDMSSSALKFSSDAALLSRRCASSYPQENNHKFCDLSSLCSANIQFSSRGDLSGPICSMQCEVPQRAEGRLDAWDFRGCFRLCTGSGSEVLRLGEHGWFSPWWATLLEGNHVCSEQKTLL